MNAFTYRWNLRTLHRARERVLAAYRAKREEAKRERKGRDEIESIISMEMHEVELIDDDIESLEHSYLIESARRLLLPTPKFNVDNGAWVESRITGRVRLSRTSMMEVRSAIRKERKERREGAILWLTAFTGIIGALTGLIAVWSS